MKKRVDILVLTYWSYNDALIQTYTLPYLKIISKILPENSEITLVTLEKETAVMSELKKNGRIAEKIKSLPLRYHPFGLKAFMSWNFYLIKLLVFCFRNKITFIHAWCTPAGAIAYLLSVFSGKKLILDSFEPHAESMVENNTWKKGSLAYRLLFYFEKLQLKRAKAVIVTTASMKEYMAKKYNFHPPQLFIKPACVDLQKFSLVNRKKLDLLKELNLEKKIIGVYAGKFGGIYLKEEVFEFLKAAYDFWGDKFHMLLLGNTKEDEINLQCKKAGIPPAIITHRFVPHKDISNFIGLADFAITPVKPVPTKRHCTPIKNGEYWALGLPIIMPANISDDSQIIAKRNIGYVLKDLNQKEYLASIRWIDNFIKEPMENTYKKVRPVAEQYRSFSIAEKVYRQIYDSDSLG